MPISVVFDPPLPSDSPSTFNTKAFTLLGDLNDWSTEANALPAELAVDLVAERSATATLTNKTLTSPDINGGTIDGVVIGSTTPADGSFTSVNASVASIGGVFIGADQDIYAYESATNALTFRVGASGAYRYHSFLADGSVSFGNNRMMMDAAGAVTIPGSLSLTGGTFGYGTGAGGTVTQATSKSTAVTLNKPCGQITMNNAALAAGATVFFYLNNSTFANGDLLILSPLWGTADYQVWPGTVYGGTSLIAVKNISAGSLSDALVVRFAVIKGAAS